MRVQVRMRRAKQFRHRPAMGMLTLRRFPQLGWPAGIVATQGLDPLQSDKTWTGVVCALLVAPRRPTVQTREIFARRRRWSDNRDTNQERNRTTDTGIFRLILS